MRWSSLAVAGLLALTADAGADRPVETWVGTWTGKATWTECSAAGGEELTLAIRWQDGALHLDGAALYDGLGELVPEQREGDVLVHQTEDLTIELKPGKKGKPARIALTTAAQCRMSAKLTRDGTGIAACDELVALADAATGCQVALDDDPADELEAWRALTGKKARKKAGAACAARAGELRERLVAHDCVPPEDDPGDLPACREVWTLANKILRCDRLPAEAKQRTIAGTAELRRSLRSVAGKQGVDEVAAAQCAEVAKLYRENLELLHCQ
jgi:hypothetical protein